MPGNKTNVNCNCPYFEFTDKVEKDTTYIIIILLYLFDVAPHP